MLFSTADIFISSFHRQGHHGPEETVAWAVTEPLSGQAGLEGSTS